MRDIRVICVQMSVGSRTERESYSCSLHADHLLRHILCDAPGPNLWPVSVAAVASVAWGGSWRPCVGREPQGQEESHPHGRRRCRHLRRLLVPDTGAYWKWYTAVSLPSTRDISSCTSLSRQFP